MAEVSPATSPGGFSPARPNATRWNWPAGIAFAVSVLLLLLYSQIWVSAFFGDGADPDSSALMRAVYFPAYLAGLLLVAQRPFQSAKGLAYQPFLLLLLVLAFASTWWSVAPDLTMRRSVALALTTLGGLALGARWRWSALTEVLASVFLIMAVGSLAAAVVVPQFGRMQTLFPGAWRGLFLEKNILGFTMCWGALMCAAAALLAPKRAPLWWPAAGLCVLLLLLSTSKTSLLALGLGLAAFFLVLAVRKGGVWAVAAIYLAVVTVAALAIAVAMAPQVLLDFLGKDATLTGRTKIWSAVLALIHQRPWLGYGYWAVWTDDTGWGPLAWVIKWAKFKPSHAHDSWLEQWLGLGLLGLGTWALCYLTTLLRAIVALFHSSGALTALPFLAIYTLVGITESDAVTYNDLRWVLFVAIATRLALGDRVGRAPKERITHPRA